MKMSDKFTVDKMCRQIANMILSKHKAGTQDYPPEVITIALRVTGDLE